MSIKKIALLAIHIAHLLGRFATLALGFSLLLLGLTMSSTLLFDTNLSYSYNDILILWSWTGVVVACALAFYKFLAWLKLGGRAKTK